MRDFVWVLKHPTNKLTKTWNVDGTISNYDDPKLFIGTEVELSSIHDLSKLLFDMEDDKNSCLIRGKYKGYAHSAIVEPDDSKKNRVLRRKSVHNDVNHHWLLVDIDNFIPVDADVMLDHVGAIEEFITTKLPNCFHGASYHWQLSSSSGHPSKDPNKLKAHVWFWLKTPYTSSQLRLWANRNDFAGDKALFDTIQVHYTATPIFEDPKMNPYKVRSGFVEGDFGDEVALVIDENIISEAGDGSAPASRHQKLTDVWSNDPVIVMLQEKRMVKGKRPDGGLNIECPRKDHHTGDSGESSTIYYAAHTGGHKHGSFVCLHEHCRGVAQSIFLDSLGFDDTGDVFSDLSEKGERSIPEAKHLCTDQANANRIVNSFGKGLITVGDMWYAFDGVQWKSDDGEAIIKGMNLSKLVGKERDEYLAKAKKAGVSEMTLKTVAKLAGKERDDYIGKARKDGSINDEAVQLLKVADSLNKWAQRCEMGATINAALSMTKKLLSVDSSRINSNPWLLNCSNGTVDLRTMSLKPHDPEDMITKCTGIPYEPNASCYTFMKVLARVMMEDGRAKPLTEFVMRWFGYGLTGSTREQKFVVHYGNGRNGKSTILDAVANVMGDYAGVAAPGLMMSADRGRHPTEIADLFGRRSVTAHETGEGGVLREDFIKQATGGDKMKARYMGKDFFEFNPTHKLQLLTNHKPVIKGQDDGIWRRVLLVPYVAKFGTQEEVNSGAANYIRDTTIAEALENEKIGILAALVSAAAEWYRDGLNPPDIVLAASKQYQSEQDRVLQFINEHGEIGRNLECYLTNGETEGAYSSYSRWCKMSGIHALSKLNFLAGVERVVPFFNKYEKLLTVGGRRRKVTVLVGFTCDEYYEL